MAKNAKPTRWERFLEQKTAPQRLLLALASIVTALGVVIGGIFALATTLRSAPAAPEQQSHEALPSCSTGSGDWATIQGQTDWIGGWVEGKDQAKSFFDAALTVAIRDIDPASSSADFVTTADSSKCESKDVKPGDSWSLEEGKRRYRVKFLSINTLGDAVELQLKCRATDAGSIENCNPDTPFPSPWRARKRHPLGRSTPVVTGCWAELTSTLCSTSSARAVSTSNTTSCIFRTEPGVDAQSPRQGD